LFGISLRWQAFISYWQPPTEVVDEQVQGPYRLWVHTHRFHENGDRTTIEDVVRYRLPFAAIGDIFDPLVRLQLERIFRFRQSAVRGCLLGEADDAASDFF
jgi:ligand-binding SRPBCC domain-containing protein